MQPNKLSLTSLFLFVLIFNNYSFSQPALEPKIVVKPTTYDFGTIQQDSVITTYFVVSNKGDALLKINKVGASCGCTAVIAKKDELKPGESTELKVTFDSKDKIGKQSKTVYVETNDPKNPTFNILLTGIIVEKVKPSSHTHKK